ncbi:hypothetical protein KQX54_017452 [Cotesia glomerata]|uniref:Uncharacterized protein n=1 Tax=Cotesia glomerata TaxID=32391 RepID=A0AAV7HYE4_COTGL|nr:hypothetical protein KQX54_017452 [Cotesia glomerata]
MGVELRNSELEVVGKRPSFTLSFFSPTPPPPPVSCWDKMGAGSAQHNTNGSDSNTWLVKIGAQLKLHVKRFMAEAEVFPGRNIASIYV